MRTPTILHVTTAPPANVQAAELLREAGVTIEPVTLLDISLGRYSSRKIALILVMLGDFSDTHLDTLRRLRHVFVQPLLAVIPAYNESYMARAYEAGVDECLPSTVGHKLAAAKVHAWLRMVRRTRERRKQGLRPRHKAEAPTDTS